MAACAHHSNSACHRAPTVMIAISDSRRSIDVPNLSFAPSEDSRHGHFRSLSGRNCPR
jgi:hypothetical protein